MNNSTQFIYSIFDGSPFNDGQVWPHEENVELTREDEDIDAMAVEILESASLGCQAEDYEVGDRISIIVWELDSNGNAGTIAVQKSHRLTVEDLGLNDDDECL